jgi:hypothetical protein
LNSEQLEYLQKEVKPVEIAVYITVAIALSHPLGYSTIGSSIQPGPSDNRYDHVVYFESWNLYNTRQL